MSTTRDKARSRIAEHFRPKRPLNVWQWAEQNVILSARISPRPGPYRTHWCPYVRAPQEDFTNPDIHDIVLCWASRTSKTETALNCIRYSIAEDPQSMLIVMPNENLARSFSESRLQPSIEDSPALRRAMPSNSDSFKLTEMAFRRCSLWLVGANSPANLKGRGVTILMLDEIDTWPHATEKETGAIQQVLERTKDRWNRKHILTSTPTVEYGQIWREFILGDQRYYFVPCPHCGEMQTLKLRQVKWSDAAKQGEEWDLQEVKRTAYYECIKCQKPIRDADKLNMLGKGEWRATAKGKEPSRRSYHLNSLYPEWLTFGEVAAMFLQSKSNSEDLQRFVNSWLAEPFFMWGDKEEFNAQLDKMKAPVVQEGIPDGFKPIMSIDVQADRVYFVVRAWNKNRDSILIEYGMLPGFEEAEIVSRKWKCLMVFVDSRYRPQAVVEWCSVRPGWIAIQGTGGLSQPMRWAYVSVDGGLMKGKQVRKLLFRPNDWKEELNNRIHGRGPKWQLPEHIGDDYKKQMAGEHRLEKRAARGVLQIEWVRHGPNHYWDCETMNIVGFESIRAFAFEATQAEKPPPMTGQAKNELEEMRDRRLPGWRDYELHWPDRLDKS